MSLVRTRVAVTALALAAAVPVPSAHAATAAAAYWEGGATSSCTGGTCTYSASSATCDDVGVSCTATFSATVTLGTGGCSGSGKLTFTSGGDTTVVNVVVRTGPSITVAAFAGTRAGGTNDTVATAGALPVVCAASSTPFVSSVGFAGTLSGLF